MLRQVVRRPGVLSIPDYVEREGVAFFEAARDHGLAGVVAKRLEGKYEPGRRSTEWLITRVSQRAAFAIGGFTYGGTSRVNARKHKEPFASLLLGAYDRSGDLQFVCELAGGFDTDTQASLAKSLDGLATPVCPFATPPYSPRLVFWCEPTLVASVSYSRWSEDGRLTFPRFDWLRRDIPARACTLPGHGS
jgi:bifunctional non-homologous end joining protein LigD